MARRRERGVYAFATPPGPLGAMTARYRLMRERGDWESFQRTILPIQTLNYDFHIPCLDTDLSPETMMACAMLQEPLPGNIEPWMLRNVSAVTSRTMRRFERVYRSLGEDYVLTHYCPVAWAAVVPPDVQGRQQHAEHLPHHGHPHNKEIRHPGVPGRRIDN